MENNEKNEIIAVDVVLFTIQGNDLMILLIVRDHDPHAGDHALPGIFIHENETFEQAVERLMHDKAGISSMPYIEQLYTFGDPGRDPRGRVITVSYLSLVNDDKIARADTSSKARWCSVNDLPPLAFDHEKIVAYAMKRLRWKIEYSTAAFAFLPIEFTLASVKNMYEIILGKKFSSGNFWRRFLSRGILIETGNVEEIEDNKRVHRPGKLYRLKRNIGEIVSIF